MAAAERYSTGARWLHASVAVLVVVLLILGVVMTRGTLGIERLFAAYQWHKSLGACVWLLMLVRVAMRWRLGAPALPTSVSAQHAQIARGVHGLLYALLLIMPVTGWLLVSASPLTFPISLFGLVEIPSLPWLLEMRDAERQVWYGRLKTIHQALAWSLGVLVLLHIVGAVRHGRTVLARMSLRRATDAS
jgi:cytochrome b561